LSEVFFSSGDERVERGGGGGGWTGLHCRSRMRDWRVFAFVGLEEAGLEDGVDISEEKEGVSENWLRLLGELFCFWHLPRSEP
jgi:hypothetical protein